MDVEIKSEVEDADSLMDTDFSGRIYDYSSANLDGLEQSIDQDGSEPFTDNHSDNCCKVCGDSATGMYFGALVCVPCKTFFLRYGGGNCIFECKFDKNCEITSTSRTQCKYCRYQKCIQAGMCRKVRPTQVHLNEGQQLCVVCNDVANGVHFGAITCEGCKKFFRRGLTEHNTYSCKNEKRCLVNPRTRNSCRYCRYQKCLSAGMSREAIQMGRPSKVRAVNGGSGDVPRHKEPKPSKDSAESNFAGPTEDWLKYYTDTAMRREMSIASNNGLSADSPGVNPTSRLVTNGLKSSTAADQSPDENPFALPMTLCDVESISDSSVDDERGRIVDSFELSKAKTAGKSAESFSSAGESFGFAVPWKGSDLRKAAEPTKIASAQLDGKSAGRPQFPAKSNSQSSNNGSMNDLFTSSSVKWSAPSTISGSSGLNRALSMSSGGYCKLNTTMTSQSFRQRAYSEHDRKELSSRSDVVMAELDNGTHTASEKSSSLKRSSADGKTSGDGKRPNQNSSRSSVDLPRNSIASPVATLSPFACTLSELQTSNNASVSPRRGAPTAITAGQSRQPIHRMSNMSGSESDSGHPPTASSLESSLPSFSSPLSDISLVSPNSTSSRSIFLSGDKRRTLSDRDSPYCTIFALASSCQLFSEASKNPFERDGSCDNDPDLFERICSEQQSRVIRKYWLEPSLPDENIIFNEKHKEIIKQILGAYERFVQTGTNVNETLRKELENLQTSEMSASLPEWIQKKVVPVYTFSSITYCKSLPGFQDFVTKDQATLIRLGQSQSRILVAANHWYDPKEKKFHDFLSWRSEDLFKKKLIKYAESIHSLELDQIESAVLNVLILIATDYPGLKNPDLIEESRQQFLCAFRAYTTAKYGTPNKRLENLFRHIPECRSLGFLHYKMTMTASLRAEEVEKMFVTRS